MIPPTVYPCHMTHDPSNCIPRSHAITRFFQLSHMTSHDSSNIQYEAGGLVIRYNGEVLEPSGEFSSSVVSGSEGDDDDDDEGLSGGAIIGIVVAVVVGVVLVTLIVVRLLRIIVCNALHGRAYISPAPGRPFSRIEDCATDTLLEKYA